MAREPSSARQDSKIASAPARPADAPTAERAAVRTGHDPAMNDTLPSLPTEETATARFRPTDDAADGRPQPRHDDAGTAAARHRNALPPGTKLLWYHLERVLGHGAFGITYLAQDENLHRPVAIKEFLPGQIATRAEDGSVQPLSDAFADDYRAGLASFISEARTLAQLEHPAIVRVHNVFEANETAYLVMHYEDGEGLDRILKRKRILEEPEILRILGPLLSGLEHIHARGFVHRDIKPANVFIRRDGSPVLLDFGSARQAAAGEARTLTNFVSPGYAPIEQYAGKSDQQGPWSDIYGLGATLYRAMTGHAPPDAVSRSQAIAQDTSDAYTGTTNRVQGDYSPALLRAVDRALQFRVQDRPQDIAIWRQELPPLTCAPDDVAAGVEDPPTMLLPRRAPSEPETGEIVARFALRPTTFALGGALAASLAFALYVDHTPARISPIRPAVKASAPAVAAANPSAPPPPVAAIPDTAPPAPTDPPAAPGARITALLAAARADLEAQRLTTPADQNAYDKFHEVLRLEPDNAEAKRGVIGISDRYLALGYRELDRGDLKRAESFIAKAEALTPRRPATATAREMLAMKREALAARAVTPPPAAPAPAAAEEAPSGSQKAPGFFESLGKLFGSAPRAAPAPVEDRSEQFRKKLGGQ